MKILKMAFVLLASGWLLVPVAWGVLPEAGEWVIDSELNGLPGRGFQIDVQDRTILVLFMGYGSDGSATWYLSTGTLSGNTFSGSLEQYAGGTAFGATPVSAHSIGSAGSVTLTFTDATHGTITLPGEAPKAVSRLQFGGAAAGAGVRPLNGLWAIDQEIDGKPGRGLHIDVQGQTLVAAFYGYRTDGAAQWHLAAGPFANAGFAGSLDQFSGGTALGASWRPAHWTASAGTMTLKFTDSAHGQITLPGETAKKISRLLGGAGNGSPAFNMAQTLSDGAQRTTLAFSGLAMITGNLGAQSFFPPGKVADYTGFQYLRDNDPDSMGHNTSFLTRIANNVIFVLDDAQFAQLKTLAVAQQGDIDLYGYKRFPLMKAFRRTLDGDIPAGSTGLNLDAVKKASRELYLIDGQISFDRALLYASIVRSMTAAQKAYLDAMKGKGWNSWPDIADAQIRPRMSGLPQGTSVAVMTYASDLFSWYAGSLEADVYFCPERHGTYYGGFYIKDAPAVGHEGYSIDEQLTATAGRALSDASAGYVTESQAAVMSSLVAAQKDNLYASPTANIVATRTAIAAQLRTLLQSTTDASAVRARVLELSALYGELDGANNHAYAMVFAQVNRSLTSEQRVKLAALRKSIMSGTYADGTAFDFSTASTPYLYSSAISDPGVLAPYIGNTDYLFFAP
jgi:hypothetical protein